MKGYLIKEIKDIVRNQITERLTWLMGDVASFQYVRENAKKIGRNLGGGNVSALLIEFAFLEYLSGIYFVLTHDIKIPSKKIQASCNQGLKSAIKKYPVLKNCFVSGSRYPFTAKEAFIYLIKKSNVDLGLDIASMEVIWDRYRNGLAHTFCPKKGSKAIAIISKIEEYGDVPSSILRKIYGSTGLKAFAVWEEDIFAAYPDIFLNKIEEITKHTVRSLAVSRRVDVERVLVYLRHLDN